MPTLPESGQIVQRVVSAESYFKPFYALDIARKYDNGIRAISIFKMMQREMPVTNEVWNKFEETLWRRTITLAADSGGGGSAGANATVVLAASDLNGNGRYFPRVGDIVTLTPALNDAQAYISDITETNSGATVTVTLTPLDSSVQIGTLPANTELAITSSAFGQGTGQPESTQSFLDLRSFRLQILKETIGAEGGILTDEGWVDQYEDGQKVRNWYHKEFPRAENELDLKEEGAILLGQTMDNNITVPAGEDGAGNSIHMTQGIIPWIRSLGGTVRFAPGSWDFDDLDTGADYLRTQGVNSVTILHLCGWRAIRRLESQTNSFATATAAGDVMLAIAKDLVQAGKDDASVTDTDRLNLLINYQARYIQRDGFTHVFVPIDTFSNPVFLGAGAYDFNERILSFPLGKVNIADADGNKVRHPNIVIRYKAKDGYSRRREVWVNGAAGGDTINYIGDVDATKTYFRSHIGLEFFRVNQSLMQLPTT